MNQRVYEKIIDHILENRCLSRMKLRMYGMKDLPQRQRYKRSTAEYPSVTGYMVPRYP